MSNNNKIIVNMPGNIANKYMQVSVVFSKATEYHIILINTEIQEYWHLPKSYRTGQFYKELNALFDEEYHEIYYRSSITFHDSEWITFEFENEEEALYFKLKYCS